MDPYRDIHALVTGGTRGIGLAAVRRLALRGARVSVIAPDDAALAALRADPPPRGALFLQPADVSRRAEAEPAVAACVAAQGPCDLLITSAGTAHPAYFHEIPADEFENDMAAGYFATLNCVRAVVPAMMTRRRGAIAAVSSTAALVPLFGFAAYGPSQYAVRGLADILRIELRPHGIHVACVYPADVDLPEMSVEGSSRPAELRGIFRGGKPIPPEQVADAILKGVARRRPVIYPDTRTRWLARLAAAAPGLTRLYVRQSARRLPSAPD